MIRPGAIGDCIVSLPAMEALRAPYTEVWAPSQNLSLIRWADHVQSIASTGLERLGLPDVSPPDELIDRLRSFDSIVSWYGSNRPEFRESISRLDLPFHFLDALPPRSGTTHAVDFYLKQVRPCLTGIAPFIPTPECPDLGFIAIHPFSGSPGKNWPLDRFTALASRSPLPVRWCAGPDEQLNHAVRFENLYDLACWLRSARLYIGNDSGIGHLAAAVGTPVLALFGPTDPRVWSPRGPRVRVITETQITEITVDDVDQAAHEMLDGFC